METKTYFANHLTAAMEVARQELGPDALLLHSKPAAADARQFGRVEVTFAWDPAEAAQEEAARGKTVPISRLTEMDEIRLQIAALQSAPILKTTAKRSAIEELVEESARGSGVVFDRLLAAGLGIETARETAREIPRTMLDPGSAVAQLLARRIAVTPFAAIKPGESRMLAFVGPPGRGKTTSMVKIAVAEGLARRVPVRIYSLGAHGIGGQEQSARYAAILGVPHQSYESIESLNLALNGDSWRGLALIDTPGLSVADRNEMRDLGRFFTGRPEIEKHLVLRADAHSADMLHVIARFAGMGASRLLFSGLDDALSLGAMAETLIRGGIPATFAGTGQQIPEDLEQVEAAKLGREVWVGGWVSGALPARVQSRAAAA